MRRYDAEGPFEIINGEVIPVSPSVFGSGHVAAWLHDQIVLYLAAHPDGGQAIGSVFSEMPFVLPDTPSSAWVTGSRVPDLMFIRAGRLADYKAAVSDWRLKPLALVPDLVVEVISPTDRQRCSRKSRALPGGWRADRVGDRSEAANGDGLYGGRSTHDAAVRSGAQRWHTTAGIRGFCAPSVRRLKRVHAPT
jgi:hypothetical protein